MKHKLFVGLAFFLAISLTGCVSPADKAAIEAIEKQIKNQVDEVVTAIDGGKKAEDFKKFATEPKYYVFIMDQNGYFLVHPDLKDAGKAFGQMKKATAEGIWVEYEHTMKIKRSYVKRTKDGLIVRSGYFTGKWF